MKYRVVIENRYPTFFYRKKDAVEYQSQFGGTIQRKIGCEWCGY